LRSVTKDALLPYSGPRRAAALHGRGRRGGPTRALLNRERDRLFPDEMFAGLFSERGRRSVLPCVVATVMVLQPVEGLSDREAVDRYAFDARWRYAAGVGGYDGDGWARFAHTVLVDMRAGSGPRTILAGCSGWRWTPRRLLGWSGRSGCQSMTRCSPGAQTAGRRERAIARPCR